MSSRLPTTSGTFQPMQHRSGTLRDRLHGYTKQTLGAGGSINEAVRFEMRSVFDESIYPRISKLYETARFGLRYVSFLTIAFIRAFVFRFTLKFRNL